MLIAKEYKPWLLGFIIINVIATLIMNADLELIGDLEGTKINDVLDLWLALSFVCISYLTVMTFVFVTFKKIKVKRIKVKKNNDILGFRLGVIICIFQVLFFIFNTYYGVNTAGSGNNRVDTPFAFLWVLVPADTLFVIYYAFYRDNKLFKLNFVIWLLSNFIRGWAGIFLFVIFFEWCRLYRKGTLHFWKVLLTGVLVLALYPLLSIVKWIMRASGGEGLTLSEFVANANTNLAGNDYAQLIYNGIEHIIGRLQLTSVLTEVINLKSTLQAHYNTGDYLPFWMEGLHGIIIEKFFYDERTMYLGTAFTEYASFGWDFVVGDWNISVGLPAWFIIAPYLSIVYILYILLLCFLSVFFIKLIGETNESNDLLWLTWFVYLIPLWLGTFVAFIYALLIFLTIKYILSIAPSVKMRIS